MASIHFASLHNASCKPVPLCYSGGSVETTADRIGVLNDHRRTTAIRRYFYVRLPTLASNGRALVGEPSGSPVSDDAGTPTLPCARPPAHRDWCRGAGSGLAA